MDGPMTFQASPKHEQEPPNAGLEEMKIQSGVIQRNNEISVMQSSIQKARVQGANDDLGEFGYNAARLAVEAIKAREAQEQLSDSKAEETEQEPAKPMAMANLFRSHNYYEVSPKNSEAKRGMRVRQPGRRGGSVCQQAQAGGRPRLVFAGFALRDGV